MRILLVNWQDRENPQAGGAELHLDRDERGHADRSRPDLAVPGGEQRERACRLPPAAACRCEGANI